MRLPAEFSADELSFVADLVTVSSRVLPVQLMHARRTLGDAHPNVGHLVERMRVCESAQAKLAAKSIPAEAAVDSGTTFGCGRCEWSGPEPAFTNFTRLDDDHQPVQCHRPMCPVCGHDAHRVSERAA